MVETYRVEIGDAATDRDRILDLWDHSGFGLGRHANAARYDWFYCQNPQGLGRIYLLITQSNQKLVGTVGVGARVFHVSGHVAPVSGGVLVDFIVHPEHRTMFPALLLQRAVRAGELRHCNIQYGLPDIKAIPIMRRLGSAVSFSSHTFVRVIRTAAFIRKRVKWAPSWLLDATTSVLDGLRLWAAELELLSAGVSCRSSEAWSPQFDACVRNALTNGNLVLGDRSRETMEWRARSPEGVWKTLSFHDTRNDQIVGFALYSLEEGAMQIMDILLPPESERCRAALLALSAAASAMGATTVRICFGGSDRVMEQLQDAGFSRRDFRAGYLFVYADNMDLLNHAWWFTRADEDV